MSRPFNIWIALAVTIILSLLVLMGNPELLFPVHLPIRFDLSDALQVLLMYLLVTVTIWYARQTKEQAQASREAVDEMREQRVVASQPLIIQESICEKAIFESSTSEYFSHFVIGNAGNGPAIELVYSILNEQKSSGIPVHHKRRTFLRSGKEIIYSPELFRLEEGKYYFVCQYMKISRLTGKKSFNQTWLPFKVSRASKEGKVYVASDELSFRFDVPKESLLDVFPRSSKPQ